MADDQWADGYEAGLEQGYAERDKTAKEAEKQAAADLEKLLRKAELKGLLASEHDTTFEETITGGRITRHDSRCRKCKRIAILEKARAILDKKS